MKAIKENWKLVLIGLGTMQEAKNKDVRKLHF